MSEEECGWVDPVTPRLFPGRPRAGNQVLTPWRPASQLPGENSCVASPHRGKTSVLWKAGQDVTENRNSRHLLQPNEVGSKWATVLAGCGAMGTGLLHLSWPYLHQALQVDNDAHVTGIG